MKDRLDPVLYANGTVFSELSLRLCGAIGYVANEWPNAHTGGGACWLDMAMFPLFAQLLWGVEGEGGCGALWRAGGMPPTSAALPVIPESVVLGPATVPLTTLQAASSSFFCEINPSQPSFMGPLFGSSTSGAPGQLGGRCVYAARASPVLTAANTGDAVTALTNSLNRVLQFAAKAVVVAAGTPPGPTRVYEHINRCAAQLMRLIEATQGGLQQAYGTWGPSGVYVALALNLYEVPVAWLHHAMLIALLSTMDASVPAPDLSTLGSGATVVPLYLWSAEDRAPICQNQVLSLSLSLSLSRSRVLSNNTHAGVAQRAAGAVAPALPKRAPRVHVRPGLHLAPHAHCRRPAVDLHRRLLGGGHRRARGCQGGGQGGRRRRPAAIPTGARVGAGGGERGARGKPL